MYMLMTLTTTFTTEISFSQTRSEKKSEKDVIESKDAKQKTSLKSSSHLSTILSDKIKNTLTKYSICLMGYEMVRY